MTLTAAALSNLPPPPRPLTVAVYDFSDQTGALKPSPNQAYADFSKAVTQGASSVLVDSLKFMGNGAWFTVVERSRLDALLRERKLIQDTYSAVKLTPEKLVSPLQFAEYLFEGGIISFDATTVSGGVGATYLGIGPAAAYLKNFITVTLRMVEVRTGHVVTSVTTSKTIYSVSYNLSYTKFVSVDNLLNVQASISTSEPTQIAVREAIEAAVYQLVQQAAPLGLWSTRPPEVIPVGVMARAMRDSLKSQSDADKKTEPDRRPAAPPPKSSPSVSQNGGALALREQVDRQRVASAALPAPTTASEPEGVADTDLVFATRSIARSGAMY